MKQLLQDLRSGTVVLEDVPVPQPGTHEVVIRSHRSLISAGTERMLNQFASGGYLSKARQQPDRVKQVVQKARTDGLLTTIEAVQGKLDERMPLGYCNAGEVIAVGSAVRDLEVGHRVISNGPHAEVVAVPRNLVAQIPDGVPYDTAVYTVAASIALQGIRLAEPTLGERVGVFGLGLVGLLAVQLLRANGCQVIGFDFAADRVELAREFGAEAHDLASGADPVDLASRFSGRSGLDAVVITASTSSDELVHQAAQMSRQRGRLVLTGVVGLDLQRADFYEKELQFTVSCSYGPGRYDPSYEQQGNDYPIGHVRWTEQRNFQAVLDLLGDGRLDPSPLTGRTADFAEAPSAYDALRSGRDIGIILRYDVSQPIKTFQEQRTVAISNPRLPASGPTLGVIGAGAFANSVLLPGLAATGARMKTIASRGGTSGSAAARRFDFEASTTDTDAIFDDPEIDAVVITTRHDTHAGLVCQALDADKDVFVEKPLCIDRTQLGDILTSIRVARQRRGVEPVVMVGFNRRFAPTSQKARGHLRGRVGPAAGVFLGNAGALPADHWAHDPLVGGGRIIGEACHYVDLLRFLIGSPITSVSAIAAEQAADVATINLSFKDGSIGTVHYLGNGPRSIAKERIEVLYDERAVQIDNFRTVRVHGVKNPRRAPDRQRKGHPEQFAAFVDALRSGALAPIPFEELVNVTEATIAAFDSIAQAGAPIELAGS